MSFYLLDNAQPITQQWGYPRRGASLTGTCIIHTAECAMDFDGADSSAENCANFIRTRSDYGSYHTLVDSDSIIEMAPYEYETWQDSETNPWAVGLSAAVQADNWHTIPADRRDRIYRNLATAAADFVTYMATKGITVPLRRITGTEARNRVPGFCAHGDSGIDRHDPGAQFDWALFFKYTQQALGGTITAQSTNTKEWDEMATEKQLYDVIAKALWEVLEGGRATKRLQTIVMGATAPSIDGKLWTLSSHLKGTAVRTVQIVKDVAALRGEVAGVKNQVAQLAKASGAQLDTAAVAAASAEGTRTALAEAQALDAKLIADAVVDEQAARLAGDAA